MAANATAAAVPTNGAVARPASAIAWQPCHAEYPGSECATIQAPLDYAGPKGATVGLTIARTKATDPAKRRGVLFIFPGGPGGSGVDRVMTADRRYGQALREAFDIVSYDQRGVYRSRQILCDRKVLEDGVSLLPTTADGYQQVLGHNTSVGKDCRTRNGELTYHADTTTLVRDIDLVRASLGEQQLSAYGSSYGTQVGQQYAELFPGRIRALVLDANMDHSITSASEYVASASAALETSFEKFAAWCATAAKCALKGRDVPKVWEELYAKATAGTLKEVGKGIQITPGRMRSTAFAAMYSPKADWIWLSQVLAAWADGTPQPWQTHAPTPPKPQIPEGLAQNSYQTIWCSDWRWAGVRNINDWNKVVQEANRRAPHTRLSEFYSDVTSCQGWPGPVRNPQHRLRVKGAPTILFANSVHDVATPYSWATGAKKQIPGSVLLTYEGVGHGTYAASRCAAKLIESYLLDLKAPADGTRCPDEAAGIGARSAGEYLVPDEGRQPVRH